MSIHNQSSFNVAQSKGAHSAATWETWKALTKMSKRELAEIALHLGAACSDSGCDEGLSNGDGLARVMEERTNLKNAGLI